MKKPAKTCAHDWVRMDLPTASWHYFQCRRCRHVGMVRHSGWFPKNSTSTSKLMDRIKLITCSIRGCSEPAVDRIGLRNDGRIKWVCSTHAVREPAVEATT